MQHNAQVNQNLLQTAVANQRRINQRIDFVRALDMRQQAEVIFAEMEPSGAKRRRGRSSLGDEQSLLPALKRPRCGKNTKSSGNKIASPSRQLTDSLKDSYSPGWTAQPTSSPLHSLRDHLSPRQEAVNDNARIRRDRFGQACDNFRHLEVFGTLIQLEQASLELWDAAASVGEQTPELAASLRNRLIIFSRPTNVPFLA